VHSRPAGSSEDSGLIMRSVGIIQQVLVASRGFLDRHGRPSSPAEAAKLATLSYSSVQGPHVWKLVDPDETEIQIRHEPTLIADDMALIRQAAVGGMGIAQLPLSGCLNEIRQGLLEIVLPDFLAPLCEIQVVFPSKRGCCRWSDRLSISWCALRQRGPGAANQAPYRPRAP